MNSAENKIFENMKICYCVTNLMVLKYKKASHKIFVAFYSLIMYSDCFDELDLEDNLIGDLAAREILEALEFRKEHGQLICLVHPCQRLN